MKLLIKLLTMLLTKLVCVLHRVEDGPFPLLLLPLVLEHPAVHASVFSFDRDGGVGRLGINDEVVVAVRAVFVRVIELLGILAEAFLAFLAGEGHLKSLQERMCLLFLVALGAVEPFLAYIIVCWSLETTETIKHSAMTYSKASGSQLGHSGRVYCKVIDVRKSILGTLHVVSAKEAWRLTT